MVNMLNKLLLVHGNCCSMFLSTKQCSLENGNMLKRNLFLVYEKVVISYMRKMFQVNGIVLVPCKKDFNFKGKIMIFIISKMFFICSLQ